MSSMNSSTTHHKLTVMRNNFSTDEKLCKFCFEPNGLRRNCCRASICDHCYVKGDLCPQCGVKTKREERTGATFQIKPLSEHEECRHCLDPGLMRRCCGQYYCDGCYYSSQACRSCGFRIDRNERENLWNLNGNLPSFIRQFDIKQLCGMTFLTWFLVMLVVIGSLGFLICIIYSSVSEPVGVYGYHCHGLFRQCDVTVCADMSYGQDHNSLPPLSEWSGCTLDSTEKLQSKACVYDHRLFHLSQRRLGFDICEDDFRPGIVVFEDTFEQWEELDSTNIVDSTTQVLVPKTTMKSAKWETVQGGWVNDYCGFAEDSQDRIRRTERGTTKEEQSLKFSNALSFRGEISREIITKPLDLTHGGTISTFLFIAPVGFDTNPNYPLCKTAYQGSVVIQYSVSTTNDEWVSIATYLPAIYRQEKFFPVHLELPKEAHTSHTRIRVYQPHYESARDSWALDNFRVLRHFPNDWKGKHRFQQSLTSSRKQIQRAQCCLDTDWCIIRLSPDERKKECSKEFPWFSKGNIDYNSIKHDLPSLRGSFIGTKEEIEAYEQRLGVELTYIQEMDSDHIKKILSLPITSFSDPSSLLPAAGDEYYIPAAIDHVSEDADTEIMDDYIYRLVEIYLFAIFLVNILKSTQIAIRQYFGNREWPLQGLSHYLVQKYIARGCLAVETDRSGTSSNESSCWMKLWKLLPFSWRVACLPSLEDNGQGNKFAIDVNSQFGWWLVCCTPHWSEEIHDSAREEADFKAAYAEAEVTEGEMLRRLDEIQEERRAYSSALKKQKMKLEARKRGRGFREAQVEIAEDPNYEAKLNENTKEALELHSQTKPSHSFAGLGPASRIEIKETKRRKKRSMENKKTTNAKSGGKGGRHSRYQTSKVRPESADAENNTRPTTAEDGVVLYQPESEKADAMEIYESNQTPSNEELEYEPTALMDEKDKARRQNLALLRTPFDFEFQPTLGLKVILFLLICLFGTGFVLLWISPTFSFRQYYPSPLISSSKTGHVDASEWLYDSTLYLAVVVIGADLYAIYQLARDYIHISSSIAPLITVDLSESSRMLLIGKTVYRLKGIHSVHVFSEQFMKYSLTAYIVGNLPWATVLLILRQSVLTYQPMLYVGTFFSLVVLVRAILGPAYLISVYYGGFYFFTKNSAIRDELAANLISASTHHLMLSTGVVLAIVSGAITSFVDTRYLMHAVAGGFGLGLILGMTKGLFRSLPVRPNIIITALQPAVAFRARTSLTCPLPPSWSIGCTANSGEEQWVVMSTTDDLRFSFLLNHGIDQDSGVLA